MEPITIIVTVLIPRNEDGTFGTASARTTILGVRTDEDTERERILAANAKTDGLTLEHERDGKYAVRDPRQPNIVQLVTVDSCTCRRFEVWQNCQHNALVRDHCGLI